jgi:glucokinase
VSNVIAVDIGGTHFRTGLFDPEGRPLHILSGNTLRPGGREWMLQQIREQCRTLLQKSEGAVRACGVSFGGPVDYERQRVRSMHAPGWENFPLAEWVRDTLGLSCRVDNDANCGALGEYLYGAGRDTDSLVFITISTGIGGGIVWGGQVFRGKDGLAGEFGHMPMADSPIHCSCGARGCLEIYCSGPAIASRARELADRRPESHARMVELSGSPEDITAKGVFEAAANGDMAATQIVDEAARWFARGLLMLIRVVNPDKIILGGGVTLSGNTFLSPVKRFMKEMGSPAISYTTEVQLAELGQNSPLHGAAALALGFS